MIDTDTKGDPPQKKWKNPRNKLKDKNLKVCELALDDLGLISCFLSQVFL
jgi:hypothetical protein